MVFECYERQIKLCDTVLKTIQSYCQDDRKFCEAGGVLLGRENISNDNLIIEYATEPLPKDRRYRRRFFRTDKGHIEFYHELYKKNSGIYVYVGEWHTHPEAVPNYSLIDLYGWEKIRRDADSDVGQIHLIAGYDALRAWYLSVENRKPKLLTTFCWKR